MASVQSGEALGASYRLREKVGSGAAGEVWRVDSTLSTEPLVAKLLHTEHANDPALVERFVRERSVLLSLRHPYIVAARDMVVEGDRLAIVMDFIAGGSGRDLLKTLRTLPPSDALEICAEVLQALSAAHAQNVMHRDIKPDNVLLAEEFRPGQIGAVRVSDFGIASVVGEGTRLSTGLIGTPHYMSPELISQGESGPPSDVYSVGVMLYEFLAGRTPFAGPGTDFTIAYRHVTSQPPQLDIPANLWDAVSKLLAKDPRSRPTAADGATRLRELAEQFSGTAAFPAASNEQEFSAEEHPATAIRGMDQGSETIIPSSLPPELPQLGDAGNATILRSLPKPAVAAPAPVEEPAKKKWDLKPHVTRRNIIIAASAALLAVVLIVGVILVVPKPKPSPTPDTSMATAHQQDDALPTGLRTSREAEYDPQTKSITLTLRFSADKVQLAGDLLEVIPPSSGDTCPAVLWKGVTAAQNQPSLTGLTAKCGWDLKNLTVKPKESLTAKASIPMPLTGGDAALDKWLQTVSSATGDAVSATADAGGAYPVQRLQTIDVKTPDRAVSQSPLSVTLVPVWPSGPDELNPLYSSPSAGKPSQMLYDIAGGESGVRFSDGCSGALAVSQDGLQVTALSVAPKCTVLATVGNFTNLKSSPFDITTR